MYTVNYLATKREQFLGTQHARVITERPHKIYYTLHVQRTLPEAEAAFLILSVLQPTCKPLVMMRLAHHAQSVKPHIVNVLPNARRLASRDSNGSVLAGGTFLPQKQRRRGRAAYLNAEFRTEHDEPPACCRQARHATSK